MVPVRLTRLNMKKCHRAEIAIFAGSDKWSRSNLLVIQITLELISSALDSIIRVGGQMSYEKKILNSFASCTMDAVR
jgi:hypothetical protein